MFFKKSRIYEVSEVSSGCSFYGVTDFLIYGIVNPLMIHKKFCGSGGGKKNPILEPLFFNSFVKVNMRVRNRTMIAVMYQVLKKGKM